MGRPMPGWATGRGSGGVEEQEICGKFWGRGTGGDCGYSRVRGKGRVDTLSGYKVMRTVRGFEGYGGVKWTGNAISG